MSRALRAGVLAAVAGLLLVPAAPASAGSSDAPDIQLKVRSISLDGYTGNITVKARARCTGSGTASWSAHAVQNVRASGTAEITCDGQRRRSRIVLDPANGFFRPGSVAMDIGVFACGKNSCTATGRSFTTTV